MLPTTSMTLAIVDDDEDVRTALARLLRSMGHAVRAFDSAEAFEAEPTAVDCVIVDVRLPGLSGLELRDPPDGQFSRPPLFEELARTRKILVNLARDLAASGFDAVPTLGVDLSTTMGKDCVSPWTECTRSSLGSSSALTIM